jgi:hypothetical protein
VDGKDQKEEEVLYGLSCDSLSSFSYFDTMVLRVERDSSPQQKEQQL